jgi:hypothetical protein
MKSIPKPIEDLDFFKKQKSVISASTQLAFSNSELNKFKQGLNLIKYNKLSKIVILSVFFLFFAPTIFAQELKAKFQDWNFFKVERGDRNVCYLASIPIKRDGNYDKRGEPFFLVTNIENDSDEISVSAGFIYNQKSNVEISFGSKKFYLFPYKTLAWANDKADDIDIIKEMQKHEDMAVGGVSYDGKISSDIYSLIGFAQAYNKMKNECKELR